MKRLASIIVLCFLWAFPFIGIAQTRYDAQYAHHKAQSARHKMMSREGEVLVYSDSFDPNVITDDMPLGLQNILRAYQQQHRYSSRQTGVAVEPLLKSLRTQEAPYNGSCPYYTYKDGTVSKERCISGCVATALEQVISYYRYPTELKDTLHGWTTDNYTIADVMPGTKIDWDNILTNYENVDYTEAQAKAIADLTYYLGVASHMSWTPTASAASVRRVFERLYTAFDYKTLYYLQRGLFSPQAWDRMLRNELQNGRPIVYTGDYMMMGGHCFVIDGVDEDGYYHCNWADYVYDCWLDLDYMNPLEAIDEPTQFGMVNGFCTNQTALFMHPDDFEIDISDSLRSEDALHGVVVDTVTFNHTPTQYGYTRADFSMTNTTSDSLNFTFEVMMYLPTDTAIFQQAKYIALSTVNLAPHEHVVWPVYCQFTTAGDYLFTYSADDETTPYVCPIHIEAAKMPIYTSSDVQYDLLRYKDADGSTDLTAQLSFDLTNTNESGLGCNNFTYILTCEELNTDVRHFNIPEIEAGTPYHECVKFHHLQDGETYQLLTRDNMWKVIKEFTFTVHADEAADKIRNITTKQSSETYARYFDLSGRIASPTSKGILIHQGKKIRPVQ